MDVEQSVIEEKVLEILKEESRREGLKLGLEEGREKGREELFYEIVEKMTQKGKSVFEISSLLDVEQSVIESIQGKIRHFEKSKIFVTLVYNYLL